MIGLIECFMSDSGLKLIRHERRFEAQAEVH